MRRRPEFRPGVFDHLEGRVALSPAVASVAAWVQHHPARAVPARVLSPTAVEILAADRAASMSLATVRGGQGGGAHIGIVGFSASENGPMVQKAPVARHHNLGHFAGSGPGFGHGGGPNFGGHGGGLLGKAGFGSGGAGR